MLNVHPATLTAYLAWIVHGIIPADSTSMKNGERPARSVAPIVRQIINGRAFDVAVCACCFLAPATERAHLFGRNLELVRDALAEIHDVTVTIKRLRSRYLDADWAPTCDHCNGHAEQEGWVEGACADPHPNYTPVD